MMIGTWIASQYVPESTGGIGWMNAVDGQQVGEGHGEGRHGRRVQDHDAVAQEGAGDDGEEAHAPGEEEQRLVHVRGGDARRRSPAHPDAPAHHREAGHQESTRGQVEAPPEEVRTPRSTARATGRDQPRDPGGPMRGCRRISRSTVSGPGRGAAPMRRSRGPCAGRPRSGGCSGASSASPGFRAAGTTRRIPFGRRTPASRAGAPRASARPSRAGASGRSCCSPPAPFASAR